MAISYSRNKWKKADVLTADKLNNTEIALEAIVNKVNGVSYDENSTPTTLEDSEKIASIQDINDAIDDIPKASTSTYGVVKVGSGLAASEGVISISDFISEITTNKLTANTELQVGIPTTEDPNDPLIITPGNPIANFNTTEIHFYKPIYCDYSSLTVGGDLQVHNNLTASGNIGLGNSLQVPATVEGGIVTKPAYETIFPNSTSIMKGATISLGQVCRIDNVQSNINLYGQIKLVSLDTQEEVTLTAAQLKAIKTACNITD